MGEKWGGSFIVGDGGGYVRKRRRHPPKPKPVRDENLPQVGRGRHSSLFNYMETNVIRLDRQFAAKSPNWAEQAKLFAERGLRDAFHEPATPDTTRATWQRVKRAWLGSGGIPAAGINRGPSDLRRLADLVQQLVDGGLPPSPRVSGVESSPMPEQPVRPSVSPSQSPSSAPVDRPPPPPPLRPFSEISNGVVTRRPMPKPMRIFKQPH